MVGEEDVEVDLLIQMTDATSVVNVAIMPMTVQNLAVHEVAVVVDPPDIQGKEKLLS